MIPHRTRSNPGAQMSDTETKLRHAEWERFQAKGMGASDEKLAPLTAKIEELRAKLDRPKVERKASGKPLEKDTLKAIMELLHRHPKVGKVWRQNSGTFKMGYGESQRYVRANTAKGMADIMGILKDGRTLAIEVKSPTGLVKPHQYEFLEAIRNAGGMAFVARSVDDVINQLGRA
jgi:hypothetical protein